MTWSKEWNRILVDQKKIILKHHDSFPVKVGAIAKELGIIVKSSTLRPGISGFIKETEGVVLIKINRHDSKERQRFTLAHEIAHFLLHKEEIKNGIEDTMLYRSKLSNEIETEANKLAADIVMPYSLLKKSSIMQSREISLPEKIEKLAQIAEISIPAMEIRLSKKDFW